MGCLGNVGTIDVPKHMFSKRCVAAENIVNPSNPAPPVVNHTDSTPAVEAVSILDIMVLASGDETATPILDVGIRSLLS